MSNLLSELEAVVGLCDMASAMMPSVEGNAAIREAETAATNWVITHHAEIAAAVMDAALLDFLETDAFNIFLDARKHGEMTIGTDRGSIAAAMSAREGQG